MRISPAWLVVVALAAPLSASAQIAQLTVSGYPVNFPAPSGNDFSAGYIVQSGATSFTVDALLLSGTFVATVAIRCGTPCPAAGPKSLSTLRWRRADLGTWNTLTTSNVVVEQRSMRLNNLNDPWSNQIVWRFDLSWLNDPPGAASNFNIIYTLTVTTP